jgi:Mn-dependent DtxR family transcriptional regulator
MQGQGLITYPEPGRVKLTDTGRREAEWPEEIADADGLYYAILDVLKQAESDVFRVLWDAHEDGEDRLTREELAQRLERAANTGAFNSLLGKLNKMGVVTYPAKGCVALADEVSPAHGGVFA